MSVFDVVYTAVAFAFFIACDRILSAVDERQSERIR